MSRQVSLRDLFWSSHLDTALKCSLTFMVMCDQLSGRDIRERDEEGGGGRENGVITRLTGFYLRNNNNQRLNGSSVVTSPKKCLSKVTVRTLS